MLIDALLHHMNEKKNNQFFYILYELYAIFEYKHEIPCES